MVRSTLSVALVSALRSHPMNGEPTEAPATTTAQPGPGVREAAQPRPWSPAAAMEPVPPLAPPPARPGAGTRVTGANGDAPTGGRQHNMLILTAAAFAIAVILVVVLALGR